MTRAVVFAVLVLVAAPALAQDYARPGFALGAGISYAGEDFDDVGSGFDDTAALDVFGSYRFHPNLGVEARFEHTLDFEGDLGPYDVDVNLWSLTANLQVFVLTGQFQPFVGVGLGYGGAEAEVSGPIGDDDVTDPVWRLFGGLDSYVTPNMAVGLEAAYNFGIDDLDDLDYWTLSALFRYRF
jgi:opacity protein-like surface antigen